MESAEQRPRFIQTRKMRGVSDYLSRVLWGGRMGILVLPAMGGKRMARRPRKMSEEHILVDDSFGYQ